MASHRPRANVGNSFASRRGHTSQLSISDPSHHVTEAIGTLYGEDEEPHFEPDRPLSFIGGGQYQDHIHRSSPSGHIYEPSHGDAQARLSRTTSDQTHAVGTALDNEHVKKSQTMPLRSASQRSRVHEQGSQSPLSPTLSLRDVQADPTSAQFPLTNIDNPSDIAQELSNLQALRRLSMDVGNSIDPDMPPMSLSAMPAIAPRGDDDENDPSRLLWVPARVHPELAPSEFRSFLENRVQSIKRRSGETFLSLDGDEGRPASGNSLNPGSLGSLQRSKSKLSRQIDNTGGRAADGYVDGAERLERSRSASGQHHREVSIDELVSDPSQVVKKLAQESQRFPDSSGNSAEDMPILPVAPGMGLRRSTRTTYRKGGSLRSGEKLSSRRLAQRNQDNEISDPGTPPTPSAPLGFGLSRVQSEPIAENYSRPSRSVRRHNKFSQESPAALPTLDGSTHTSDSPPVPKTTSVYQDQLSLRTEPYHVAKRPDSDSKSTLSRLDGRELETDNTNNGHAIQASSSTPTSSTSRALIHETHEEPAIEEPPARSSRRPAGNPLVNQPPSTQQQHQQQYTPITTASPQGQTVNQNLAANPSPYPGSGGIRTDALTFIPTAGAEERKTEKKSKKDKDDDSSSVTSGKSGSAWKWFKGGNEEKEKKKDEGRKSRTKALVEKAQDNVRLDVIQSSIDKNSPKGRESLVLDRDNVDNRLQEERKKESTRKSDSKKEKDGSLFSSIFGGSKKKDEKEKQGRRNQQYLAVPEDPPYKPLQPDVDYHWTRFPLLEERAIYRMAHIKLANPRRPLHSQVLLSNFMYSYLAIVQAMHPQMNVPTSPQQKRIEEETRRKRQEEEYLAQQMQMQEDESQDLDQYDFDYHRSAVQYAESGMHDQVDYVDDAQIYEDEHGGSQHDHGDHHSHQDHYSHDSQYDEYDQHDPQGHDDYDYERSEDYGQGAKEYYQYHDNNHRRDDGRDDMW